MRTEKITLWGIVQGVGFRPFVAKIADRLELNGSVRNTGGLVEIFVTASKSETDRFVQMLLDEKPKPAEIVHIKREVLTDVVKTESDNNEVLSDSIRNESDNNEILSDAIINESDNKDQGRNTCTKNQNSECSITECKINKECKKEFNKEYNRRNNIKCKQKNTNANHKFTILTSSKGDDEAAMIPADLAICDDCLAEMRDPMNSRYNHPMISCMVCGPRYTITDVFPYDRENTSMSEFAMCEDCHNEYTDVHDRRYHAQTISCHDCGPYLKCRVRKNIDILQETELKAESESENGSVGRASDKIAIKTDPLLENEASFAPKNKAGSAPKKEVEFIPKNKASFQSGKDKIYSAGLNIWREYSGCTDCTAPENIFPQGVCSESNCSKINSSEKNSLKRNFSEENFLEQGDSNQSFSGQNFSEENSLKECSSARVCSEITIDRTQKNEKWHEYSMRTDGSEITTLATKLLKQGEVIAFKSMGGYNLIADPLNDRACEKLRTIKKREAKPFAVMFESVEQIEKFCKINAVEKRLIKSSARPIILLERKCLEKNFEKKYFERKEFEENSSHNQDLENLVFENNAFKKQKSGNEKQERSSRELERSRFIGAFLPSMGAQYLMLEKFGGPLIVTSANAASMPMIRDDDAMMAMAEQEPLIAAVIYNDRKIRIRMDDSVARVIDGQPQLIRRSKGYAPVPLYVDAAFTINKVDNNKIQIFAAGGQLKNSFALSKDEFVYMSQYFGDMDSEESQNIYAENVERMAKMFRIQPQLAVCDMHPLYFSTAFCEEYAKKNSLQVMKVQHHHAHVASVMAEHNLTEPVIGVSFDGTGYGTDGAVWGGEFLICHGGEFERKAHLKYIEMPGGDESMKDAAKAAVCYKYALKNGYSSEDRKQKKTDCREIAACLDKIVSFSERNGIVLKSEGERKLIEAAVRNGINTIKSSSMGRLFDAVAALLGICSYNSYEGECAILLEDAADRAIKRNGDHSETADRAISGMDDCSGTDLPADADLKTDTEAFLNRKADIDNSIGLEADSLALEFHMQIRDMILENCKRIRKETGISNVALTGGVFQNKILTESTLAVLRENSFNVYYNVSVSPNDGGIALGQTYIAMNRIVRGIN